ncbi:MAG: hypothetical protein H0U27_05205 [Nitrosopumilus sp.]|nr:hypothetical protein [Nitrosopumilus sp.]
MTALHTESLTEYLIHLLAECISEILTGMFEKIDWQTYWYARRYHYRKPNRQIFWHSYWTSYWLTLPVRVAVRYKTQRDSQHNVGNTDNLIEIIENSLEKTNTADQLCILGGDWNAIINQEDSEDNERSPNKRLIDMMTRQGLIDIDKTINPQGYCRHTYPVDGRQCTKARLDYFMGNHAVISNDTSITSHDQTVLLTDHKLVIMNVKCKVFSCTPPKTQLVNYILPGIKSKEDNKIWIKFSAAVGAELDKHEPENVEDMFNKLKSTINYQMGTHFKKRNKKVVDFESDCDELRNATKEKREWMKKRKLFNKNEEEYAGAQNCSVEEARETIREEIKRIKKNIKNIKNAINREKYNTFNNNKNRWFFSNPKKFYAAVNKQDKGPSLNAVLGEGHNQGHVVFGQEVIDQAYEYYQKLYKKEFNDPPLDGDNVEKEHIKEEDKVYLSKKYTVEELEKIVQHLPNGKGVGPDGIPYEVYKYGGKHILPFLTKFINKCIEQNHFPEEFKHGRIFLIYKKGNPYVVGNYRPITLLNTCYKLFTTAMNIRLTKVVEENQLLSNEQGGFRKYRSCVNKIRTIINVIDDSRINNNPLHIMAIDFEKAFDSISHEALFQSLEIKGLPPEFISIIKALYTDCFSDVITGQGITKKIKVEKGVRQGDALSPLLFNLFIDSIAKDLKELKIGYEFTNGNNILVNCALFADDLIIIASSNEDLKILILAIEERLKKSGLKINIEKTIYVHNESSNDYTINISGKECHGKDKTFSFRYLGAHIRLDGKNINQFNKILEEIKLRINKLSSKKLTIQQAVRCINVIIIPVITYASEVFSWTQAQLNKFDTIIRLGFNQITKLKRCNIGKQFVFAPVQNGGLGVIQPSTSIQIESIYGLYKAINFKRDNLDSQTIKQRLLDIQIKSATYRHPVESLHNCKIEHGVRTYLSFALQNLKKHELIMRPKECENTCQDYSIVDALKNTRVKKLANCLFKAGIFRRKQLPKNITEAVLQDLKSKYKQLSHLTLQVLQSIVNKVDSRKEYGKIPYTKDNGKRTPTKLITNNWNEVTIYTDGGYDKVKNVASFGLVVDERENGIDINTSKRTECSRIPGKQDNYRAELYGILRALQLVKNHQIVTIRSDSLSSIEAITNYVKLPKEARVKFSNKLLLDSIRHEHKRINKIIYEHVRGHCGEPGNEKADKLATKALKHKDIRVHVVTNSKDKFAMQYNSESCVNTRDYLKEHIMSNMVQNTSYKYNLLHNDYHDISTKCWEISDLQMFLTRARSNQLATKSKMNYWSRGLEEDTCPRCNLGREDQLHLIDECSENDKLYRKYINQIVKFCNEHKHYKLGTKPLIIYGTPFIIDNSQIIPRDKILKSMAFVDYRWKLGLITKEESCFTSRAGYKKPRLLASKILTSLSELGKEIWMQRNQVIHFVNNEIN